MLAAREREIKRKEMLKELHLGNSIITINYCFDKIAKLICPDLDLNFAKQLFRGAIRPDIVIYQDKESCSYEELFSDYVKFYKVSDDKDNIILNYIDDFCSNLSHPEQKANRTKITIIKINVFFIALSSFLYLHHL